MWESLHTCNNIFFHNIKFTQPLRVKGILCSAEFSLIKYQAHWYTSVITSKKKTQLQHSCLDSRHLPWQAVFEVKRCFYKTESWNKTNKTDEIKTQSNRTSEEQKYGQCFYHTNGRRLWITSTCSFSKSYLCLFVSIISSFRACILIPNCGQENTETNAVWARPAAASSSPWNNNQTKTQFSNDKSSSKPGCVKKYFYIFLSNSLSCE